MKDALEYDFERVLTAFLKLAFYKNWDYPVRKDNESDDKHGAVTKPDSVHGRGDSRLRVEEIPREEE